MNFSGFTAEDSLAKTGKCYRLVSNRVVGTRGREIIPQQDFVLPTPRHPFFRCSPVHTRSAVLLSAARCRPALFRAEMQGAAVR